MKNVVVTGGSGKAGKAAIHELGQTIDAFRLAAGVVDRRRTFTTPDAVIHLAGIPAPGLAPDAVIFQNNLMTTYNVFAAATMLGIPRVVWASSETLFGLPLTRTPPRYAPMDEAHPATPENSYALAKYLCEEMARQMHRWNPGTRFVGLRISNILEPADYATMLPIWQADPNLRKWNLWSYVDSRDVAQACRLAVEAAVGGAENFVIAAADTLMPVPNRTLMAEAYPEVPLAPEAAEHQTLLSIEKARRELGYQPSYSWRSTP
jgi:nucleoside-diphosphate-sugar epimerase